MADATPVDQKAVVDAVMSGPWTPEAMVRRVSMATGHITEAASARALVERLGRLGRPDRSKIAALVADFYRRTEQGSPPQHEVDGPPALPSYETTIHTRTDLCRLLDLHDGELDWFADRQGRATRTATPSALRHYRYRVIGRSRLLEIPKPRLKEIQRRVRRHVLRALPVSVSAHGGVPGRSVRTATAPHAGHEVVLRFDLEGFFPSVTADRVYGLLGPLDAEPDVRGLVTGLCTSAVPPDVVHELSASDRTAAGWRTGRRLAVPHLPQGAPTSPLLANATCAGLDRRLAALAETVGGNYTRYVDDLLFSGDDLPVGVVLGIVREAVRAEGFRQNEAKTLVHRRSQRQSALSVVLNDGPTVRRTDVDRLRAVLHNCATRGPQSQARGVDPAAFRRRLLGQVAWVNGIDPSRGARLRAAYDRIAWPADDPG